MKALRLVTLTHPLAMIADQLAVLSDALSYLHVPCVTSTSLDPSALNVVIEGFTPFSARYVAEFCERYRKKICLVMTEHVDRQAEVIINDVPLSRANAYLPNASRRLRNLCHILPYVRSFWIVGHLPHADKLARVFASIPIVHVPYPPMSRPAGEKRVPARFELSFTGTATQYRTEILTKIKRYYKCCDTFSDDVGLRRKIIANSAYTLQVPQHAEWYHISPMRALFALKCGTPVLNISDFSDDLFDAIVPRIAPRDLIGMLASYLDRDASEVYEASLAAYNSLADQSVKATKLTGMLSLWDDLEETTAART